MTAAQLEEMQKQAYQEAYEQGRKEGFEYGHREALEQGRKHLEQLEALISALDEPLKQMDDQVEQEILELVLATVKQLVRREVKNDPGQIIGVVREALSILPVSSRNVRLVLHPDDAQLVREIYDVSEKEIGWTIVEDPVLEQGGCKVLTEVSQVDATLESRLSTLIAQLMGSERKAGEEPEEQAQP
jgi:flagellar assembly protein FliH